jgi:hypothetical protein
MLDTNAMMPMVYARVPAGINKLECNVDDGLVVEHLSTHDPVTAVEALEMGANKAQLARLGRVSNVSPVSDG